MYFVYWIEPTSQAAIKQRIVVPHITNKKRCLNVNQTRLIVSIVFYVDCSHSRSSQFVRKAHTNTHGHNLNIYDSYQVERNNNNQ